MGKRNRNEHEHADSDGSDNADGSDNDDDDGNNTTNQSNKLTEASSTSSTKQKKIRKLKLTATEDFNAKLQKRGIVYLARIPPRMGPSKVKTLLSDFGPISRIYLAEEDKSIRKKRRKAGGSGVKGIPKGG